MSKRIVVTATGDSLITRRIPQHSDGAFKGMVELIQSADASFTNLEVPLSNYEGAPVVESGGMNLSVHPGVGADLMDMGFNLAGFANNHTLNYGIEGCLATIDALDALGFTFAGAGRNLAEARMPAYLDTPTARIGLVACASSFATGQRAGAQTGNVGGRPGLNPQRFDTLYVVDQDSMNAIKRVAAETGAEEQRQRRIWLGFGHPPRRDGEFIFADRSFIVGPEFGIKTEAHQKDLEANLRSVEQAAANSHLVMVSMHAHEQGITRCKPADFIIEFARACIDAGADAFFGHGPHLLRGMEIYKGKPIFYSLGNFFFQYEYLERLPADDYESLRADPSLSVTDVMKALSQDDQRSFPSERGYWETVLPVMSFEDRTLVDLRLHPLELGFEKKGPGRGTPRLADTELAEEIMEHFVTLSDDLGTRIEVQDGVGRVLLD